MLSLGLSVYNSGPLGHDAMVLGLGFGVAGSHLLGFRALFGIWAFEGFWT